MENQKYYGQQQQNNVVYRIADNPQQFQTQEYQQQFTKPQFESYVPEQGVRLAQDYDNLLSQRPSETIRQSEFYRPSEVNRLSEQTRPSEQLLYQQQPIQIQQKPNTYQQYLPQQVTQEAQRTVYTPSPAFQNQQTSPDQPRFSATRSSNLLKSNERNTYNREQQADQVEITERYEGNQKIIEKTIIRPIYYEKIVEIQKPVIQEVEKIVEKEVIVEKPVIQYVEKIKEVEKPVIQYVDRPVYINRFGQRAEENQNQNQIQQSQYNQDVQYLNSNQTAVRPSLLLNENQKVDNQRQIVSSNAFQEYVPQYTNINNQQPTQNVRYSSQQPFYTQRTSDRLNLYGKPSIDEQNVYVGQQQNVAQRKISDNYYQNDGQLLPTGYQQEVRRNQKFLSESQKQKESDILGLNCF